MLQANAANDFFTSLENCLPPLFDRETAAKCLGGIISPKTLANLDSLGKGPKYAMRIGKKIAYEKVSFLEWIKSRIK